jgi:hypothetical protein
VSILRNTELCCPGCGARTIEPIAESVNAGRSAPLRELVRKGEFQRYTCAACGQRYAVDSPFSYIDFPRRLWFCVFPLASESRWRELENEPRRLCREYLVEHGPPHLQEVAAALRVRAIFGLDALREKVLCLEAGLDDRALEACKLDVMRAGGTLSPQRRRRLVAVDDATIVLSPDPTENAPLHLRREALDDPRWATVLAELGAGPYVDLGRVLGA